MNAGREMGLASLDGARLGSSAKGKAGATLPGLFWVPEGQGEMCTQPPTSPASPSRCSRCNGGETKLQKALRCGAPGKHVGPGTAPLTLHHAAASRHPIPALPPP